MFNRLSTISIDAGEFRTDSDSGVSSINNNVYIHDASIIQITFPDKNKLEIDNKNEKTLVMKNNQISGFSKEANILYNNKNILPVDGVLQLSKLPTYSASGNSSTLFNNNQPSLTKEELDLLSAAKDGDFIKIRELSEKSVNMNIRHPRGYTPLYIASESGHVKAVRELLQCGANIDMPDKEGTAPVWIAACRGFHEIVSLFAQRGAKLNIPFRNDTPLNIAIVKGHIKVINVLSHFVNINQVNDDKQQLPIITAIQFDEAKTNSRVSTLLQCQANPNIELSSGLTPIFMGIYAGNAETVKEMLKYGASVNTIKNGVSPIFYAAEQGNLDILCELIYFGADPESQLPNGFTPLFIAAQNNHLNVVSALIKDFDVWPDTPSKLNIEKFIQFGKNREDFNISLKIHELIKNKAKRGEDDIFVTPAEIANVMGHQEMVNLLTIPQIKPIDRFANNFMYVKF